MPLHPFATFSRPNRRLILLLISCHLLWSCALLGLWSTGSLIENNLSWWSCVFLFLQLYAAAQLLLPVLMLHPEERTRGFYLFWGLTLALLLWLINQLTPDSPGMLILAALKSGLLLLIATLVGAALARYVQHLWEIVPICIVMALADLASWSFGPTAVFSQQIEKHYLAPVGPPPFIDMILIKMAYPGYSGLAPIFGISDWIIVVFFAIVAHRHGVNDNLTGAPGERLARQGQIGRYLPVSVTALFLATMLAQATGLFIPALPLISLVMLTWYALRYLFRQRHTA
jgi:hypothetical protein